MFLFILVRILEGVEFTCILDMVSFSLYFLFQIITTFETGSDASC